MTNKGTKIIPNLTIREKETITRFETFHSCSAILREFFSMGFKSYDALKAIMLFYYPNIDIIKLKHFWNCRMMDKEIIEKVIIVFDKLKED